MLQKDLVARSLDGAIVGRPLLPDSMAANLLVVLNSVRYAVHVVTCDERKPAEVEVRLAAYDSGSPVNDAAQTFFRLWPGFTFTRDNLENGKPPARASAHATASAMMSRGGANNSSTLSVRKTASRAPDTSDESSSLMATGSGRVGPSASNAVEDLNVRPPAVVAAHPDPMAGSAIPPTTNNPMQGDALPQGDASSPYELMGSVMRNIELCGECGIISDGEEVRFHLDETAPSVSFVVGCSIPYLLLIAYYDACVPRQGRVTVRTLTSQEVGSIRLVQFPFPSSLTYMATVCNASNGELQVWCVFYCKSEAGQKGHKARARNFLRSMHGYKPPSSEKVCLVRLSCFIGCCWSDGFCR
jgi:hypothetical protein